MVSLLNSRLLPRRIWLGLCLVLIGMTGLSGCGVSNPIPELRDEGVEVKTDRNRLITSMRFPHSTTDATLEPLANVEEPTNVQTIDLAGTQVTDEGLKVLARFENLRALELNDTPITDDALETLGELKNLRRLSVGGTKLSEEAIASLPEKIPSLETLDISEPRKPTQPEPRDAVTALDFGIDLAGGTNLIYQVDRQALDELVGEQLRADAVAKGEDPADIEAGAVESASTRIVNDVMDSMVGAVARRLNPSGLEEITVRKVGVDRIEVIMPKADVETIERKKSEMTRLGSLEFAILANRNDHAEIKRRIDDQGTDDLVRADGSLEASWREWGVGPDGVSKAVDSDPGGGEAYVDDKGRNLVVFERPNDRVTGQYLRTVRETRDEDGRMAVSFTFNTQGATKFARLTSKNQPETQFKRRLAVLLDDKIHSAPNLNAVISDSGMISGRFTKEEVNELINVLNAGALTVPINPVPISEQTVSAQLGVEVREKGLWAIAIASASVVLFMLGYYRFAGMVAVSCLVLNIVLMMGTMAIIDATFSLPGLAGIVLTIGMAVDANVLIFERIREERNRGSSPRMAIQNGFDRAFTTIVDANMTTLITAVVLYMIGTDQVRGFAVTLFVGIVMSMFTALYFGRMVFEICERKRWIREPIGKGIFSAPGWDFIGKRRIAAVCSVLLIGVGLAVFVMRGNTNYDIDFSGGTMVTIELTEPHELSEVKAAMEKQETAERTVTVEKLVREIEGETGDKGRFFNVRTNETSTAAVREMVRTAITDAGYQLKSVEMEVKSVKEVESETQPDSDAVANGHRIDLAFSPPVKSDKVRTAFLTALSAIGRTEGEGPETNQPYYERPASLFEITSVQNAEKTEASSTDEATGSQANQEPTTATILVQSAVSREHIDQVLKSMETTLRQGDFEGVSNFASSVAGEMRQSAVMAMLVSLVAIVAYIWFRFQRITFGLAAVAALVHDVLVVLGVVSLASYGASQLGITALKLEDFKINLPMIAAFLTIVGYSLNDTIVVFDRIREVRGKNPALTESMINTSLNQTLSRTLLTSLTTLLVVAILYWFGGEGIHGFAFCLVLGVMVGTYSSVYVASPVLLWLMNRDQSGSTKTTSATPATTAG